MEETILTITGLPLTCNHVKIKLLFQNECKVPIVNVKVGQLDSEVTLKNKEDAEQFKKNLPKSINFGGKDYALKLIEEFKTENDPSLLNQSDKRIEIVKNSSKSSAAQEESVQADNKSLNYRNITEKEENDDLEILHHWYSLGSLPTSKHGLLVQYNDDSIKHEHLLQYFENNQISCGGPILKIVRLVDGTLILFKNDQTAEKVWNFRPHRISDKPAKTFLKAIPDVYHNKLLYKPRQQYMTEEHLQNLLIKCSAKQTEPSTIKRYESNIFLICYANDIGADEIEKIRSEFEKNSNEKLTYLPKTDCIQVKNFPSDISDEEMRILFENEKRTGGGEITKIQHMGEGLLLIYFASYQDAQSVIDLYKGKTLPIFNSLLKMSRYFHFMYETKTTENKKSGSGDNRNSNTLQFMEGRYRWLVDCKMAEGVKSDHNVKIVFNENDRIFGGKDEIERAQKSISRLIQNPTRIGYGAKEKDFVKFLLRAKSNCDICQIVLRRLRDLNINAVLTIEGENPYLWGYQKDCEYAVEALNNKILSSCEVPVSRDVIKTEILKSVKDLESNGFILLTFGDSFVKIVGFCDTVEVAQEMLTSSFFADDKAETKELKYEEGITQYIIEHFDLVKLCKDYCVKILRSDVEGILIKGEKQHLNAAAEFLQAQADKLIHDQHPIQRFGILGFVQSTEGKDIIKKTSKLYPTAIVCKKSFETSQNAAMEKASAIASSFEHLKSSLNVGNITLTVKIGDITDETSDAIVNCAGVTFSLPGEMSKAVFKKAGKTIQGELNSAKGENLRVTSAGSLPCKRIFHIITPLIIKDISLQLWEIFKVAEKKNCSSLSIPSLGAGFCGIPATNIANAMMETCKAFATDHKTKSVKFINIVIHEPSNFYHFQTKLNSIAGMSMKKSIEHQGASAHGMSRDGSQSGSVSGFPVVFGSIAVSVLQGDITLEKNDAIVNSTGPKFDLSQGLVSNAIIRKGGRTIQDEVCRKHGYDIRVTSGGRLPCRKIIHVNTPTTLDQFISRLSKVLETAENECCKSISLPSLGTGNLKRSVDEIANGMVKAFDKFAQKYPQTRHLKVVDLVIFERSQLKPFIEALSDFDNEKKMKAGKKGWIHNIPGASYFKETATMISKAFSTDQPMRKSEERMENKNYVELHLYSISKDINKKALSHILQKIDACYTSESIKDEQIAKLSESSMKLIKKIEDQNNIELLLFEKQIIVHGLNQDVKSAVDRIKQIIKNHQMSNYRTVDTGPYTTDYTWRQPESNRETFSSGNTPTSSSSLTHDSSTTGKVDSTKKSD